MAANQNQAAIFRLIYERARCRIGYRKHPSIKWSMPANQNPAAIFHLSLRTCQMPHSIRKIFKHLMKNGRQSKSGGHFHLIFECRPHTEKVQKVIVSLCARGRRGTPLVCSFASFYCVLYVLPFFIYSIAPAIPPGRGKGNFKNLHFSMK